MCGLRSMRIAVALLGLGLGGCEQILGLVNPAPYPGGSGGTGGTAGSETTSATAGQGGAMDCEPGQTEACYSGPVGTQGVGICKAGARTCSSQGEWGGCENEVVPAAETCGQTADEDCDGKDCIRWANTFGDQGAQYPLDVAVDDAGFVYILGAFEGTIDFGSAALIAGGGTDLFIAKFDEKGEHIWSKQFANPSLADPPTGFLADMDVRGDGEIVVGLPFLGTIDFGSGPLMSEGLSDVSVARLDTNGDTLWSKRFGGGGTDTLAGVGFAKDGSVLLSGGFQFSIDFGGGAWDSDGTTDGYVAKLAADDGSLKWAKQLGGPSGQIVNTQAIDSSGSVTVCGVFSGDTALCGKSFTVKSSVEDLFAARFDGETGGCEWAKQYSGAGKSYRATRGAADAIGGITFAGLLDGSLSFDGGAVVSAGPAGTRDVFLLKVSAIDGAYQWSKSLQSVGAEETVGSLLADEQKNLLLAFESNGTVNFGGGASLASAGGQDIFFSELNKDGGYLWGRRFGDGAEQSNAHIARFPGGDILLAARVSGFVDMGGGPIPTKGSDLLLARLAP